ncbi:hypothetical protein KJ603_01235, partial [Patescibacteria group bacterium]|nr:hypothetical protein [Patescibacteria group bacterium]
MEIRKSLKFILLITGIILIPVVDIYAYNNKTTHPALTKETVELFNYYYPDLELSYEEKKMVILGSVKEDDPEYRCLNHFYDPVYNDGLTTVIPLGLSTMEWSQNTKSQIGPSGVAGVGLTKELFGSEDDYSWERAIYDYAHKDKERALEALGHILHLIQDMSVPPHVRNDDHLSGRDDSPYETYTKGFNEENIRDISGILKNEDKITFNNLDDYFYSLASFTNNNFFSKDTVDNKIRLRTYIDPVIDFEKIEIYSGVNYGYRNLDNENFKLVKIDKTYDKLGETKNVEYILSDNKEIILQDYWKILSKQSVLHGSGV